MNLTKINSLSSNNSAKIFFVFILGAFLCSNISNGQQNVRDSIVELLQKNKSNKGLTEKDSVQVDLLNKLGQNLRFYKADSLLRVAEQALNHSKTINYTRGHIVALGNIGDYYSDKGNHEKAIQNYKAALEIANETKKTDLILGAQNQLANQFTFHRDYAQALEEYLTGIEIATDADNKHMLAVLNENIALLYADQRDYEQALVYFKIVKKLNEEIGDEVLTAFTTSNMADTYADMGNLEYAMYHITTSIAVFEKHELMDWLAFGYEVKGKTYLKQGKYKWAIFWYNQSQSLHTKSVEDERSEISLLNGIAEANIGLKKDSISEKYALSALEISSRLNENNGVQKSAEILYRVSKKRGDYINALSYHELFQRLSDTIAKNGSEKNLLMLKTKMNHEQQKKSLIEANEKALAKQKNYVYASLAFLLILAVITLLVRRNEKIQKNLNKELHTKKADLEKNEIELRAINETKDKMFSIIGHDLRGPIGAFQGLLQLLKNGEINQTEFLQFVPKLRTDIDNISFTLNNLLSWGQTQMNGTITQPTVVSLENLVKDNVNLLSEIAGNKSIKMISQLGENTLAWSDADQIDIVIRNLMSNALKFTPKNGMVTIDAKEKSNHWEVSVRDTGVGIDEETRDRIFAKNSNVTTYGTENEKGTGLGLSLCKEMVENNNGTIWVESVLRKGTCFYFTVPKAKKTFQQAS
ncbi:sensor histidine kinase [Maribacter algarum]|uniref:histidine kinase n=1 Tax=Maribacter algarum (ex Zhang et al. 2020) TaxID=2578118 RepID=A0A5S3PS56_9FLAO|nr:tetratricopeptide repeat-containing sensor histidine kinase [Maribacter algarum]TMM57514.1 sensor histidine kinase [Maribacter algarum]